MTPVRDLHSDEILLRGLAKSDPVSFKIIYRLHWRRLYDIAFYVTGSEEDAEDIIQDVFSSLWYRREQIQIKTALENYLVRAVKYTAFFYLKVNARNRSVKSSDLTWHSLTGTRSDEAVCYRDLELLMEKILSTLPLKTRKVFSLSRFDGLTYPEIAREMGISIKTVEYHISIALKKFSRRFVYSVIFALLLQ